MGTPRNICILSVSALLWMSLCPARGQSMDQLIAGAADSVDMFDQIHDLESNQIVHELDMVMSIEKYRALTADDDENVTGDRKKRKATRYNTSRWTDKTIPYVINSRAGFSSAHLDEIRKAMVDWSSYTCIKFKQRDSRDRNYVTFDNGNGCYSYIGMTGGSQKIGLAPGCRYKGVIVHEIGHAVGFHHEQNRPDRDNHVTILFQNIPQSVSYNFKKYSSSAINTYGVPYDYKSVMHYGGKAFSHNGQYTIKTRNPAYQNVIGNRKGLSFLDIKLANLMYECHGHCSESAKANCPSHGFLDKNCNCMCPGSPVKLCDGTTSKPVTSRPKVTTSPPPTKCIDMNEYCSAWANSGRNYCQTNSYVKLYCKFSCGTCGGVATAKPPSCADQSQHCAYYNTKGYCRGTYEEFMSKNCAKTCNVCGRGTGYSNNGDDNNNNKSNGSSSNNNNNVSGENNMGDTSAVPMASWLITMATTLLVICVTLV